VPKTPHVLKYRRLKKSSGKTFAAGLSGLKNRFRAHVRSVFKRIFHYLLGWLGIRRLREHSFFAILLARPAVVADFGAHRGEFFAALKSEHPVSQGLLIEADPALAESLKQTFGDDTDVVHAAAVAENKHEPVTFTRSIEPEASSVFKEWSAAYGIADQVKVPTLDFSDAFKRFGRQIDLIKMDVEGAEIGILESASALDLASCRQLTVEFHDKRPPFTRRDVDRVCRRMRAEGYGIVVANWPKVDDVLFVNLKSVPAAKRIAVRCRVVVANVLFIVRRTIFGSGYSS
jgi:FkbM family methyltransferase